MNGWLLDTNVIAEVSGARPDRRVEQWIEAQPEHTLFLSILTIAEYQKGIHHLPGGDKRRPRLQQSVRALEARFSGRVLQVSNQAVLRWGAISGEVKRITGQWPPVIDTLLASTALEHNLYLATRNTAHVAHSGAAAFNPWTDDPGNFPLQRELRHDALSRRGFALGAVRAAEWLHDKSGAFDFREIFDQL